MSLALRRLSTTRAQTRRPLFAAQADQGTRGGNRPWLAGYEEADQLREMANLLPSETFPALDYVRIVRVPGADPALQGVGGVSAVGSSVIVASRPASVAGDRFLAARGLRRQISGDGQSFLLTSARTEKERTERAFAAELLAPAKGIAAFLPANIRVVGSDVLEDLANHFAVSSLLVQHQVTNQLGLSVEI